MNLLRPPFRSVLPCAAFLAGASPASALPVLTIVPAMQVEGHPHSASATQLAVVFQLDEATDHPVSVDYRLLPHTARPDNDYVDRSGQVTIPAGLTQGVVLVTLVADRREEGTEQFAVEVRNPAGCLVPQPLEAMKIVDDDGILFLHGNTLSTLLSDTLPGSPDRTAVLGTLDANGWTHQARLADYNGDGIADVIVRRAVAPGSPEAGYHFLSGVDAATVLRSPFPSTGSTVVKAFTMADMNGDGLGDLVEIRSFTDPLTGNEADLIVRLAPGMSVSQVKRLPHVAGYLWLSMEIEAGDMDGDGLPDLAIQNSQTNNAHNNTFPSVGLIALRGTDLAVLGMREEASNPWANRDLRQIDAGRLLMTDVTGDGLVEAVMQIQSGSLWPPSYSETDLATFIQSYGLSGAPAGPVSDQAFLSNSLGLGLPAKGLVLLVQNRLMLGLLMRAPRTGSGAVEVAPAESLPVVQPWQMQLGISSTTHVSTAPQPPVTLPVLSLRAAIQLEGHPHGPGANRMELTFELDKVSEQPVTVDYHTLAGTALSGEDYVDAGGTAVIVPGTTTAVRYIQLVADRKEEESEDFHITLSQAAGCSVAQAQWPCRIIDDDGVIIAAQEEWQQVSRYSVNTLTSGLLPGQTKRTAVLTPNTPGDVAALGDFDGDGLADIIVRGSGPTLQVISGLDGVTPLTAVMPGMTSTGVRYVAADLNGDGRVEVIGMEYYDADFQRLKVFRNPDLTTQAVLTVGVESPDLRAADFTGDGQAEIVLGEALEGTREGWIAFYNANLGLIAESRYAIPPKAGFSYVGSRHSLAVSDVNGDGRPDANLWVESSFRQGNINGITSYGSLLFTIHGASSENLFRQNAALPLAWPQTDPFPSSHNRPGWNISLPERSLVLNAGLRTTERPGQPQEWLATEGGLPLRITALGIASRTLPTQTVPPETATLPQLGIVPTKALEGQPLAAAGATEGGGMPIGFRLNHPSAQPVSVNFTLVAGSAKAGADYVARSGTVVIFPGTTEVSQMVTLTRDRISEPSEQFTVLLSNPQNASLAQATATMTIVDDDGLLIGHGGKNEWDRVSTVTSELLPGASTQTALLVTLPPYTYLGGLADYDGDGIDDLFTRREFFGSYDVALEIRSGQDGQTLLSPAGLPLRDRRSLHHRLGDVNGDGRADLVELDIPANRAQSPTLRVSLAPGLTAGLSMVLPALLIPGPADYDFAVADVNSDGADDIVISKVLAAPPLLEDLVAVVALSGPTLQPLLQETLSPFGRSEYGFADFTASVELDDFSGDGLPDISAVMHYKTIYQYPGRPDEVVRNHESYRWRGSPIGQEQNNPQFVLPNNFTQALPNRGIRNTAAGLVRTNGTMLVPVSLLPQNITALGSHEPDPRLQTPDLKVLAFAYDTATGGGLSISTRGGQRYQLQSSSDLTTWYDVDSPFTASGFRTDLTLAPRFGSLGLPSYPPLWELDTKFFRLEKLP